jgi:hypothetical protein
MVVNNPQEIADRWRAECLERELTICMAQRDELVDLNIELTDYIADLRDEVAALEGEIDALETEAIDAGSEPPALRPDEHAALTRIARELRDAPHAKGAIMASLSWRGSPRFESWIGRLLSADGPRAVAATAAALRAELQGQA